VDLDTVLDLYGNLIGRKLIQRPPIFRPYTIQTQAPLTKAEVIHAFDVLLAYHGLKAENVGDDAFRIVFRASAEN
jgi:hypothetical protein